MKSCLNRRHVRMTVRRPLQRPSPRESRFRLSTRLGPKKARRIQAPPGSPHEIYECLVCGDEDVPLAKGAATCSVHFCHHDCLRHALQSALKDISQFPVKCCVGRPIPPEVARQVLDPDRLEDYKLRLQEFHTPGSLRTYCSDSECHRFLRWDNLWTHELSANPPQWGLAMDIPVVFCPCGAITCVSCKSRCLPGHCCAEPPDPKVIPPEYGEYSAEWRIKQCPSCKTWIQHGEACNHMTCMSCRHEFCFICLLPWTLQGCPSRYGPCPLHNDPEVGYDEEGYENSLEAIHRMTGTTREGLNLLGCGPCKLDEEHQQLCRRWRAEVAKMNKGQEQAKRPPPELPLRNPPIISFNQMNCHSHMFYTYTDEEIRKNPEIRTGQHCALCSQYTSQCHEVCWVCDVALCRSCVASIRRTMHWHRDRQLEYPDIFTNMVGPIQWAEAGVVPFKAKRRALASTNDTYDGIDRMFRTAEAEAEETMIKELGPQVIVKLRDSRLISLAFYADKNPYDALAEATANVHALNITDMDDSSTGWKRVVRRRRGNGLPARQRGQDHKEESRSLVLIGTTDIRTVSSLRPCRPRSNFAALMEVEAQ